MRIAEFWHKSEAGVLAERSAEISLLKNSGGSRSDQITSYSLHDMLNDWEFFTSALTDENPEKVIQLSNNVKLWA